MRYGKDLIAMVGLLAVCATQDLWAQSNDVYNFYFQKGSAPNSVTQGGAGQQAATPLQPPQTIPSQLPTEPPAHVDNVVVAKTTPPPEPEKPVHDYKRFDLLLGVTRVNDDLGTGAAYTFGGQYNFSRYLGVRAQGQLLAVESANYHFPIVNRDDGSNKWGGQAAFVFTPLHMELLGHQLLKVSALGGIMSVRHLAYDVEASASGEPLHK
jgi:hypothetical protein